MAWRLLPPLKLLPDEKWVWIGAASRAALRLAAERRFDVLVSFAQPWSDHLVGLRVQRATGLPWVAHFSDPWIDSPYLRGRRWQRRIWERMEADVVRHADALVFVNEQTAERVMSNKDRCLAPQVARRAPRLRLQGPVSAGPLTPDRRLRLRTGPVLRRPPHA
jgi:hypothetical protein